MADEHVAKSHEVSESKSQDIVQQVPSHSQGEAEATGDKGMSDTVVDDAAKYLANASQFAPLTPEREDKLRKKIDAWMIPLLLFTATLGAVDKVEIGTASLYGFQSDNHITGHQYSWLGSILPLGQLFGYTITTWLVHRVPPGKLLCIASLLWSILTILYPACHTWSGFMALRFFMGFIESAISPCLTMLVVSFYKKEEQPQRNAIVFAYFSSVFNGFFAWLVGLIPDSAPLAKWQYLYLITGAINILYSIFLCCFLPDNPMNARFLTAEEKSWAVERLAANRTGISNKVWKWDQVGEAFMDIRIWLIFLFNIAINIPNGGLQAFGTIIIHDLGFSSLKASLLTMPFGILATSSAWFFSYIASRWHNRRTIVACFALLLPLFGTALVYGLPRSNIAGQMIGLYFMYFYWPPYVVGISLPQANTAGQTKKSITFSLVTIGYAVGNLIGPQTFIANQAPKYTGGVIAMLSCYCAAMLLLLIYFAVAASENKRRDKKYGKPEELHDAVEGFVDITDMKQPNFRYTH
ncbi:Allantoate permease [Cytospora mali]|uniref:Allantoate permease n=1 Tax=Cytospora mali TaxID=578113 RepID=A0A194VSK1_CYTMA|nr:Allantoate permease [Valsa mali]